MPDVRFSHFLGGGGGSPWIVNATHKLLSWKNGFARDLVAPMVILFLISRGS